MSNTVSATASTESFSSTQLGIPADRAYDELIFHNREYCSRCHRQIRSYDDYRPDVGVGGVSEYAPEERYRRAMWGTKGYRYQNVNEYGYRPVHRPATYCGDCGSQHGRADGKLTLSQGDALEAARYLVTALEQQDVSVHRGALYCVVKKGKESQSLQGRDTEIFQKATEFGIRRARYE